MPRGIGAKKKYLWNCVHMVGLQIGTIEFT